MSHFYFSLSHILTVYLSQFQTTPLSLCFSHSFRHSLEALKLFVHVHVSLFLQFSLKLSHQMFLMLKFLALMNNMMFLRAIIDK